DRIEVEAFTPGEFPLAQLLVECGSGTYIRSLAADLGEALGGCAHLAWLRRLRVGPCPVEEPRTLEATEASPGKVPLPLVEAVGPVVGFAGVRFGHRALGRLVRERAAERGLPTALVTFDRHPAQVVRPESAPKLLTGLAQKLELLEATGLVDHAVVLTFDETR